MTDPPPVNLHWCWCVSVCTLTCTASEPQAVRTQRISTTKTKKLFLGLHRGRVIVMISNCDDSQMNKDWKQEDFFIWAFVFSWTTTTQSQLSLRAWTLKPLRLQQSSGSCCCLLWNSRQCCSRNRSGSLFKHHFTVIKWH